MAEKLNVRSETAPTTSEFGIGDETKYYVQELREGLEVNFFHNMELTTQVKGRSSRCAGKVVINKVYKGGKVGTLECDNAKTCGLIGLTIYLDANID